MGVQRWGTGWGLRLCARWPRNRDLEHPWGISEKTLGISSRAKQAAEKGLGRGKFQYWLLQGLKPSIDLIGLIGMTKVMPCYKAFESGWPGEFFRSL
jgi:hypothetical protein